MDATNRDTYEAPPVHKFVVLICGKVLLENEAVAHRAGGLIAAEEEFSRTVAIVDAVFGYGLGQFLHGFSIT